MPRRCTRARLIVPPIRTSGTCRATGLRSMAVGLLRGLVDHEHERRARTASHLARHPEARRETYAHCDRAPFGWENR